MRRLIIPILFMQGHWVLCLKHQEKKKRFIWEFPNYYSEKDDKMWQEYKEKYPDHFEEMPQIKKNEIWEHLDEIRNKK